MYRLWNERLDNVYFRSHPCIKYTVDYIHQLLKHECVLFRQTLDEWTGPKVHIFSASSTRWITFTNC